MKLYEVNQQIEALLQMLEPDPETGEIPSDEEEIITRIHDLAMKREDIPIETDGELCNHRIAAFHAMFDVLRHLTDQLGRQDLFTLAMINPSKALQCFPGDLHTNPLFAGIVLASVHAEPPLPGALRSVVQEKKGPGRCHTLRSVMAHGNRGMSAAEPFRSANEQTSPMKDLIRFRRTSAAAREPTLEVSVCQRSSALRPGGAAAVCVSRAR